MPEFPVQNDDFPAKQQKFPVTCRRELAGDARIPALDEADAKLRRGHFSRKPL
jgi:hypothetical protein